MANSVKVLFLVSRDVQFGSRNLAFKDPMAYSSSVYINLVQKTKKIKRKDGPLDLQADPSFQLNYKIII